MSPARYSLILKLEGNLVRVFYVEDVLTTIGRALNNTLILSHLFVSRHHAELRLTRNQLFIVDLQSKNGTFIDGERLPPHQPHRLLGSVTVRIGPFELTIHTSVTCPACGTSALPIDKFCDNCGAALALSSEIAASDLPTTDFDQPPISAPPVEPVVSVAPSPPTSTMPVVDLSIDVAIPDKATINQVFDIAVLVRPPQLPVLEVPEEDVVQSGTAIVFWPDDQPFISLRIKILASSCTIHDTDARSFRMFSGRASPILYFSLTPRKVGTITIVIELYQEDDTIGSARVQTVIQEQPVGTVEVNIIAQSLQEGRHPIEPEYGLTSYKYATGLALDATKSFKQLQLREKQRRLEILELRHARKGYNIEPEVLTEIEDIRHDIEALSRKLGIV